MARVPQAIERQFILVEESDERAAAHTEQAGSLLRRQLPIDRFNAHGFAVLHRLHDLSQHIVCLNGQRDLLAVGANQDSGRRVVLKELR